MATKVSKKDGARVAEVQKWSEDQKEQWRKLPGLCGQLNTIALAHGVQSGLVYSSPDFRLCAYERIWVIRDWEGGGSRLLVDTDTLVIHTHTKGLPNKGHRRRFLGIADSADILWLAGHLDLIDVAPIVKDLKHRIAVRGG
ncbi:hypothetical protein HYX70_02040 [Candidatus Saccharibacteria bacterium]|nr:hypothetical protein [Candidatus Saccharibacteria bacterium]